ncbi:ABC transporter ATP-binding protein [Blautia liquoris]|uniref:ABC transporter ATP-binding protein n=1 Tax=Blautia liquoris TaxID=2779518 RepID=A0A7M2RG50_9FIRM|nr:ABC transporter ATP-binding protein [Blautia liquoris]QOV19316.1 ABC transporter ATP-binding protein [Blautia liquoris]
MIDAENITAGYGDVEILHGVSFSLKDNENLSIIGPNGCGKTTLLRALAGTLSFSGDILLDGKNVKDYKKKALAGKISMLSQSTQVYFNYTVYDTVMMGRYIHEKDGVFRKVSARDKSMVQKAMEATGIEQIYDREVNTLSGGQLQRVLLAKVIAQDPDIILLDEPTNHLDLSYQVELIQFLKKWSKRKGKSVIGVLHDMNLAMMLTDRVLLMDHGKIEADGSCRHIFGSDLLNKVYHMNVSHYMVDSLGRWQDIAEDKRHQD